MYIFVLHHAQYHHAEMVQSQLEGSSERAGRGKRLFLCEQRVGRYTNDSRAWLRKINLIRWRTSESKIVFIQAERPTISRSSKAASWQWAAFTGVGPIQIRPPLYRSPLMTLHLLSQGCPKPDQPGASTLLSYISAESPFVHCQVQLTPLPDPKQLQY